MALAEVGWSHRVEGLQFGFWIDAGIHLGGLHAGVAEPERDFAYVTCGLKNDDRAGVPEDVRRYGFFS